MASKWTKTPWLFTLLTLLFLIGLGIALLNIEKGTLHLSLNAYHAPLLDWVMRIYTRFADYGIYIAVLILLIFYKAGWASLLALNAAAATIVVQVLKRIINAPRPLLWFSDNLPDVQLQLVEGFPMAYHLSCPSGHTITFFTLCLTLSWVCACEAKTPLRSYMPQVILFLLAVLGAYSRIYLSMHFAFDIWCGAALALIVCYVCSIPFVRKMHEKPFWNRNLRQKVTENAQKH